MGSQVSPSGEILRNARIAYSTFGDSKSPSVINPTWFSGLIADCFWLVGQDKALDPAKYFIVVPALFGNGESTSPTNSEQRPFPRVEYYDNVRAQRILIEHLGVTQVAAVLGFSMGGQQTYQWAVQHSDIVNEKSKIIPICSSARTSPHNFVFLEGPKSALLAGEKGTLGRKAFGRVWAGWGLSQAWYRARTWEKQFATLEEFLAGSYDTFGLRKDPDNLLVMLDTWQRGDVSKYYDGDFETAMRSIKAKALLLPCETDLYFPPEDSLIEQGLFYKSDQVTVNPIPSIWGHAAGGQANPEDMEWVIGKIRVFLGND